VPKRGKRRFVSRAEKLRIVSPRSAARSAASEIEAMLRREGITAPTDGGGASRSCFHWPGGARGSKPGRKHKLDAKDRRLAEPSSRAARLEAKLSLARAIDLQKKRVRDSLGISISPTTGELMEAVEAAGCTKVPESCKSVMAWE